MSAWRQIFTRRMLICVLTGFSSGLPLFLLLTQVPAWLKTQRVDIAAISLLFLAQFPYTWKFLWSPLLDRFAISKLGRRRGWMFVTQIGLLAAIASYGPVDVSTLHAPSVTWVPFFFGLLHYPQADWPSSVAFLQHPATAISFLVALLSATQDIALDAYRRELLPDAELGLGSAVHVNAYRLASLVPGSLALILADYMPWNLVFLITAAFMLPGIGMTLLVSEPNRAAPPKTMREAVIDPFVEFFTRQGWASALLVLFFMFFYKLGDSLCTALATPFYLDMGYSLTDLGSIAKVAGLWASVFGGLVGGVWMLKIGINRALWLFGAVQVVAIFGFAWLASLGHQDSIGAVERLNLAWVVGLEAFGVGVGSAAFVAFIARTTNPAYTATQFALFTSLAAMPRTFINAMAGSLVKLIGWPQFFLLCAALAVPGMLLLFKVAPWRDMSK